jgi:hypothetical protein
MRLRLGLIILLFIGMCTMVYAAQPTKFTGTYSDFEYVSDAGDVIGHELRIVYTSTGYEGAYQVSEGEPSQLMLVKINFTGNKISFSVSSGVYTGSFSGVVNEEGITGIFKYASGAQEKISLPRRRSYWDQ